MEVAIDHSHLYTTQQIDRMLYRLRRAVSKEKYQDYIFCSKYPNSKLLIEADNKTATIKITLDLDTKDYNRLF